MSDSNNEVPVLKPTSLKNGITGNITKPMTAVHDPDINLGHVLEVSDAPNWGRDENVSKRQLAASSADGAGAGKGGVSGGGSQGNSGQNYGAASNSGDNSGMHSSGTSSQTGIETSTGTGYRRSGAASTESNSADANHQ